MRLSVFAFLAVAALVVVCGVSARPQGPAPSGPVGAIPLLPEGVAVSSYAGYITVDEPTGSNLFYWMFEALQAEPSTAPLLVWLNGGPGSSSMYGLFAEHGPFYLSPDGSTLVMRNVSWANDYNVVYIDNPVGTGFSYTMSNDGFVTNQEEVGADLLNFIYQLYTLYPQFQKVPLYICGESYAGKYVPAMSFAIHQANLKHAEYLAAHPHWTPRRASAAAGSAPHTFESEAPWNVPNGMRIPLTGLSIGDGSMDPLTQIPGYGKLLFGLSMIDTDQRIQFEQVEAKITALTLAGKYKEAFDLFDPLMMSDLYPHPSTYNNFTGLTDYYNFNSPDYPANPFDAYLNRADVKAAIHVAPDFVYVEGNNTVESYLLNDWMQSIKPWLITLLENYPVLIYNGQNDIILSAPNCENFLQTLQWNNSHAWHGAERSVWKIAPTDFEVAGWVRQQTTPRGQPGLTYVVVRDAGHLLPQDQPERGMDMINRWINNKPFTN